MSVGNAIITVETEDGGKVAACEVKVEKKNNGDSNESLDENQ